KRNANKRKKEAWDVKNTKEEEWKKYEEEMEKRIEREKIDIKNKSINESWIIIKEIIIKSANDSLKKAKTPKNKTTKNNIIKNKTINIDNNISRIKRKIKKAIKENKINQINTKKRNEKIRNINKKKKMEGIQEIEKNWSIEKWKQ